MNHSKKKGPSFSKRMTLSPKNYELSFKKDSSCLKKTYVSNLFAS